jgi:hypothetical protein
MIGYFYGALLHVVSAGSAPHTSTSTTKSSWRKDCILGLGLVVCLPRLWRAWASGLLKGEGYLPASPAVEVATASLLFRSDLLAVSMYVVARLCRTWNIWDATRNSTGLGCTYRRTAGILCGRGVSSPHSSAGSTSN